MLDQKPSVALMRDEMKFCSAALLLLSKEHETADVQKHVLKRGSDFLRSLAEMQPAEPNPDPIELTVSLDSNFFEELRYIADEFYECNMEALAKDALKRFYENVPEP